MISIRELKWDQSHDFIILIPLLHWVARQLRSQRTWAAEDRRWGCTVHALWKWVYWTEHRTKTFCSSIAELKSKNACWTQSNHIRKWVLALLLRGLTHWSDTEFSCHLWKQLRLFYGSAMVELREDACVGPLNNSFQAPRQHLVLNIHGILTKFWMLHLTRMRLQT